MVAIIALATVSGSRRAGRCRSCTNPVERSTRVPIWESWFLPTIRSPSVRLKPAREGWVWLKIALRCGRLLGMSAQPSWAPWLLIEICAWSLVYGCVSGVLYGSWWQDIEFLERMGACMATPGKAWAGVDIIGAPSALILALLAKSGQSVRYAAGRVVAAMSSAYIGEGKTDAKDSYVIAETARIRRDLAVIDQDTDLVRNLAVLTGHRADLIADR